MRRLILEAPFLSMEEMVQSRFPDLPGIADVAASFPLGRDDRAGGCSLCLWCMARQTNLSQRHNLQALFALANEPKEHHVMDGGDHDTLVRDGLYEELCLAVPVSGAISRLRGAGMIRIRAAVPGDAEAMCAVINPLIEAGGTTAHRAAV